MCFKPQVAADEKRRMTISPDADGDGDLLIRANQGHSLKGVIDEELLYTRIENPEDVPICVHGTFRKAWSR